MIQGMGQFCPQLGEIVSLSSGFSLPVQWLKGMHESGDGDSSSMFGFESFQVGKITAVHRV